MSQQPLLTVVVPVYNGKAYLREAVDSVLAQEGVSFEVLLIDDGSRDDSLGVLASIHDERLHIQRQSNIGLAATLNRGIGMATTKYIARQDQDDILLPGRLARQAAFLESHPDCAMVGTWSRILVNGEATERGHRHPASHAALQLELLFDNPFVHSSVMLRASALRATGGYSEDKSRQPPEDYELWSRIARRYQVANLPEVLTVYREVQGSMSRTGDNPFLVNLIRISSENLAALLAAEFPPQECAALAAAYHGKFSAPMPRGRALAMHQRAAELIGGDVAQWPEEFAGSFKKQRARINSQYLRRHVPPALLNLARGIRRAAQQ